MIVLPNYNEPAMTRPTGFVNPSAASAPFRALGDVAKGIGDLGDVAFGEAMKIQAADNEAEVSSTLRKLSESQAAFQQSLLTDHDYKKYGERAESEVIGPARSLITDDMAPVVKRQLTGRIDDWASDFRIKVSEQAQMKAVSRAKDELALTTDAFMQNGQPENAKAHVRNSSWMTPEQQEMQIRNIEELNRNQQEEADVRKDPAGWIEKNKQAPTGPAEFIKWKGQQDLANSELRKATSATLAEAEDLIASKKLVTPEQVDAMFGDLRPSAKEELKKYVVQQASAEEQARLRSPAVQDEVAGDVAQSIAAYNPNGEDFDAQAVSISRKIGGLMPGPLKDEFTNQLNGIRKNESEAIDTNAKAAMKELNEAFDQKSKLSQDTQKTSAVVDAGLLEDSRKLTLAGFSPEQIAQLRGELGDKPGRLSSSKRIELFRVMWPHRKEGKEKLDSKDLTAFEAVAADESEINYQSPEQVAANRQARGRAARELAQYLHINPKASDSDIAGKMKSVGVSVAASALRSKRPPRPQQSSRTVPYKGQAANAEPLPTYDEAALDATLKSLNQDLLGEQPGADLEGMLLPPKRTN